MGQFTKADYIKGTTERVSSVVIVGSVESPDVYVCQQILQLIGIYCRVSTIELNPDYYQRYLDACEVLNVNSDTGEPILFINDFMFIGDGNTVVELANRFGTTNNEGKTSYIFGGKHEH